MKPKRILIVDDEERNVKLIRGMVVSEQYDVDTASCGQEALDHLKHDPPDLILLDVMMPDIDGFEVCRRMKQDEQTQVIPVLMVTALMEKEHRVKAMEAGADDFLSKPVDRTELLVRIKSLLRIKSYHDKVVESNAQISAANERLQKLEHTKDELTHMVVHDLMNPLTVINMAIDLLMFDKALFTLEQQKALQQCHYNCDELKRMIQSLLDIHRMEDGKLEPECAELNLAEMIDRLMVSFRASAEYNQVELACDPFPMLDNFYADEMLIKRAVSNLISNAIRHTPMGGTIRIRVAAPNGSGAVRLSVSDTGEGIDPQYHEKIFERFEQIELKRSGAKVGSSGLGLAFCKMAVEAHGGSIWVESEGSGTGTSFHISFPVGARSVSAGRVA